MGRGKTAASAVVGRIRALAGLGIKKAGSRVH